MLQPYAETVKVYQEESSDLEVVLFGFASHDDIEVLVWVFLFVLNAVGHVLLVLVRVEPYPERSSVAFQLWLWFRTLTENIHI